MADKVALPCSIQITGHSDDSGLGKLMGVRMTSFRCFSHEQKWSSSKSSEVYCPVGKTLRCPGKDRSATLGCSRCGMNHAKTHEEYGILPRRDTGT